MTHYMSNTDRHAGAGRSIGAVPGWRKWRHWPSSVVCTIHPTIYCHQKLLLLIFINNHSIN